MISLIGILKTRRDTWKINTPASLSSSRGMDANSSYLVVCNGNGPDYGYVSISSDGEYWKKYTTPLAEINALCIQGPKWVAIDISGYSSTSIDNGITWSTKQLSFSGSKGRALAYGNSMYAAVTTGGTFQSQLYYSTDAVTWNSLIIGTSALMNVKYLNGLFIAISVHGCIFTSPDGLTWLQRKAQDTNALDDVAYGNSVYVVVGRTTTGVTVVFTSPDAITWTQGTIPNVGSIGCIYSSATTKFIAYVDWVTANNPLVSTDGITWTYGGAFNFGKITTSSAYFNNKIYTSGQSFSGLEYTSDGSSWTLIGIPANGLPAVTSGIYDGTNYMISAYYGRIVKSTDMSNWSIAGYPYYSSPSTIDLRYMDSEYLVASGSKVYAAYDVFKSSDAITWTGSSVGSGVKIKNIVHGLSGYVAFGRYDNVIYSSTDFITWTLRSVTGSTGATRPYKATYGNGIYLSGYNSGTIIRSSDAITWTIETIDVSTTTSTTNALYFDGTRFIAAYYRNIYTSLDGITWNYEGVAPFNVNDIEYDASISTYVVIGVSYVASGRNLGSLIEMDIDYGSIKSPIYGVTSDGAGNFMLNGQGASVFVKVSD